MKAANVLPLKMSDQTEKMALLKPKGHKCQVL